MQVAFVGRMLEWGVVAWLAATMGFVLFQIMRGRILMKDALSSSAGGDAELHRIQLILVTLGAAGVYIAKAVAQPVGSGLPDIPTALLVVLAGSNAAYLGGKINNTLNPKSDEGDDV